MQEQNGVSLKVIEQSGVTMSMSYVNQKGSVKRDVEGLENFESSTIQIATHEGLDNPM